MEGSSNGASTPNADQLKQAGAYPYTDADIEAVDFQFDDSW